MEMMMEGDIRGYEGDKSHQWTDRRGKGNSIERGHKRNISSYNRNIPSINDFPMGEGFFLMAADDEEKNKQKLINAQRGNKRIVRGNNSLPDRPVEGGERGKTKKSRKTRGIRQDKKGIKAIRPSKGIKSPSRELERKIERMTSRKQIRPGKTIEKFSKEGQRRGRRPEEKMKRIEFSLLLPRNKKY